MSFYAVGIVQDKNLHKLTKTNKATAREPSDNVSGIGLSTCQLAETANGSSIG